MGAVTHGADTRRLRAIAEHLQALGGRVGQLEAEGTTQLGVLTEAWSGDDCTTFEGDWQEGSKRLAEVEQRLRAYAKVLAEQAEQQDTASGDTTGGGPTNPAPSTGKDPESEGLPKQVTDLDDLFTSPDRPDLTAGLPPVPDEFWPVMDRATDWANDTYKDHLRAALAPTYLALGKVSDGLGAASDELSYLIPHQATRKFVLDTFQDETDMYREIIKDPKDWWDNDASTLDKIGLAAALIPYGGAVAKIGIKTTKEAVDLIAKGSRHGDDVDPPKVVPKSKKIGSYTVPDDAIKADSGGKGNWNHDLYDPKPNSTYLVDDKFAYVTDEHGRVKEAHGILADDPQDAAKHRQTKAGGDDRFPDDQGGHIFGKSLGGPGEDINLLPMSKDANLSQYASLENEWRTLLRKDPPAEIEATVKPVYPGDSQRPSRFVVEWTKDGVPQDSKSIRNEP